MAKKRNSRTYGNPETTGTVTLEVLPPKRKPKPVKISKKHYRLITDYDACRQARNSLGGITRAALSRRAQIAFTRLFDSLREIEQDLESKFYIAHG